MMEKSKEVIAGFPRGTGTALFGCDAVGLRRTSKQVSMSHE